MPYKQVLISKRILNIIKQYMTAEIAGTTLGSQLYEGAHSPRPKDPLAVDITDLIRLAPDIPPGFQKALTFRRSVVEASRDGHDGVVITKLIPDGEGSWVHSGDSATLTAAQITAFDLLLTDAFQTFYCTWKTYPYQTRMGILRNLNDADTLAKACIRKIPQDRSNPQT
jgi:hypothetical protein